MPKSCSNEVIIVDPDTNVNDLEGASMSGQESPTTSKVNPKSEVNDLTRYDKSDTMKETEDPKPRIVLTFRSEKPGAKSSNMKIVSNEEKHDEFSPRRSSRTRGSKWDSDDDNELSPKKNPGQPISENDEASDSSHTTLKRSTRRRSKEFSENVLANAIARKEKSYETSAPTQRLSRRIKPTAKVLANKELRIGVESQNNARLGIQAEKSPEEGVRTRRSARPTTIADTLSGQSRKHVKCSKDPVVMETEESGSKSEENEGQNSVMKLKHLCELGLKAINSQDEENETDNREEDVEDEEQDIAEDEDEIDDDSEVINKLLEEDSSEGSDEDFYCSEDASQSDRPRRSTRLRSGYCGNESDQSSLAPGDDEQKAPRRRSSRFTGARHELDSPENTDVNYSVRRKKVRTEEVPSEPEPEEISNPAGGDEGSEAACPSEESRIIATCYCEEPSNIYAAPSELTEPVFCQAVEMVDGVRVGCSHGVRREADGQVGALLRAGPRAPFFLACRLHAAQLAAHMCCPACGLFCTQGIFYQCSEGHLFHVECGLPYSDSKGRAGCPHCGVHSYRWQPANRDCSRVRLDLTCSNKRIFLPDQREQCTPSYLSFSTLKPSQLDPGPVIPEDLLPSPPIDLKRLCQKPEGTDNEDVLNTTLPERRVYDAIVAGETVEQLIPKIVAMKDVNKIVEETEGLTCLQCAAKRGHLSALYLLQYAGAELDRASLAALTPLMLAVLELVDKSEKAFSVKSIKNSPDKEPSESMQVDETKEDSADIESTGEKEKTVKTEVKEEDSDKNRPNDEDLMKVIRYLVAAGCDVNLPGPEGMTALHMASQHGSEDVCAVLLSSPSIEVDPRDHGGWTPLVWATENKHYPVVRLLVREGADPCSRDSEGNAAIHWCALAGETRALRTLLDAAPDALHALNAHADTPLHVAARQGHYACVVILLARGARTDVENSAGELPVEVCSGECQSAISLNMQMALSCGGNKVRRRLLSSDISRGRESLPVPCVNEVDDEPLPDNFTYVTHHVMPAPLAIDCTLDTMQGCTCSGSCVEAGCACCVLGVRRWAVRGRLPASFPYHDPPMLFECNQTCTCNAKHCENSVVTRLSRTGSVFVRTCVYRVDGATGWGLRATRGVPRGAPVALYTGELLALQEADARSMDHYMFALDLKQDLLEQCADKTSLCVDAAQYGGAARFVNHSCRPNLAPVRVFTATRDLRLPNVVLFATTHIRAGEQLTFDYGDKFWSVKSKWMKCECGTPECRYPEKTTDETES